MIFKCSLIAIGCVGLDAETYGGQIRIVERQPENVSQCTKHRWVPVPLRSPGQRAAGLVSAEGFQYVHAITYAPSDPSIAYLSVNTSQIWKSTDEGFTWRPKNNGFVAHGARSIIVDPRNADIVFAAGFLGKSYERARNMPDRLQGIYRSTDGGELWVFVKATDFYKQESKGCLFAFDSSKFGRNRTLTIFAGSYNEGLLRSEDGGDTWQSVGFQGHHIIDMQENPAKAGELFVVTDKGLYIYINQVAREADKGLPDWPRSIAISPHNPNVVYAAVGKAGVYKSVDRATSFEPANTNLPSDAYFTDIAVSPVNSNIVYLKTHKSPGSKGPFFSHDGARSWHTPKSTDLGGLLGDDAGFWFSSPFAPHPREAMTALSVSNGRARIRRTSDGGRNWVYSGNGFTGARMKDIAFSREGRMLFCLTDHGVWLTEDDGDTFRELKVKEMLERKSSESGDIRDNTIVVSLGTWTKKGLAVSHNLGDSWKYYHEFVDPYEFIAFHPKYDGIIYAGPYRSGDGGRRWTKLSHTVRAMYPQNGDMVYALLQMGKKQCAIVKSTDGGVNWHKTYPLCQFPAKSVQDMVVAPKDPDRIYLATREGLWIFDGTRWLLRNAKNGLEKDSFGMCFISSVSVDPSRPNIVYAGKKAPGHGQSNGIFRSKDFGLTWENITRNLGPSLSVWSVQTSPQDGTAFIGTSLGTFRLTGGDD